MEFLYSKHALEEMKKREVSQEISDNILNNPQQILHYDSENDIYQSIIEFNDKKLYLVRVIIAINKNPKIIKTVYKTSKIKKYWREIESKI